MCGVTGIYHYRDPNHPVDVNELNRMTDSLTHRGPDGRGVYVHPRTSLGLGHRRLAIVDVSEHASQPMIAPDGSVLSYNGEVYNHADWRHAPGLSTVEFRSSSDTETLLHLLCYYGPAEHSKLAGIFAFAFWDAKRDTLVLARDHLGVKQLYYHDNGRRIVFASEIKALLYAAGVDRAVSDEGVNEYLHFHTPLFENTFFAGIKQLRAGEYIEVSRHGLHTRRFWQLGSSELSEDVTANVASFNRLFDKVVADQLMSDVPVGVYLSGGIDSTAISMVASQARPATPCFGIYYEGQGVVDERPYQEAVAQKLGVKLELATLNGNTFPADMLKLMYFQDQPVAGTALFSMNEVSRLASTHVKVCLGGQAADELFAGYARYSVVDPFRTTASIVRNRLHFPENRAVVGPRGHTGYTEGNLRKQLWDRKNMSRLVQLLPEWGSWRRRYLSLFYKVSAAGWSEAFENPMWSDEHHGTAMFEEHHNAMAHEPPLNQVLMWEARTYLTALFHQDDRMSMANSVESRVPFADPRMVRFAFSVPPNQKIRDGASKWLIRKALTERIPQVVLERRKIGFDTPVAHWVKHQHRDFVRDMFGSSAARQRGWYTPAFLKSVSGRAYDQLNFDVVWKAACVEVWARVFLDRDPSSGMKHQ